jgi:hypothetical protein
MGSARTAGRVVEMARRQKDDEVKDKKKSRADTADKPKKGGTEPGRTPGQAEGPRASRGKLHDLEPGRTPGQAEGTEEEVEANLKKQKSDLKKK